MTRVLFILKQRTDYGNYSYGGGFSSGLLNSAQFASDMLARNGFVTHVVEVVDNNDIDREVTVFDADVVIIEALWVVPAKFFSLQRLHPNVKWIVRVHSEAAFLSQEIIAISWIRAYATFANVSVAMNSEEGLAEITSVYWATNPPITKLLYLPTFYPAPEHRFNHRRFNGDGIDVACMGAVRPLKNNLIQAMAAITFAQANNLGLRFHVNRNRAESGGEPIVTNLANLFAMTPYELVGHNWMPHREFLKFMAKMDLSMQVSFSETFSIITADSVAVGTPIVGSAAITWLTRQSQASTTAIADIVGTMGAVLNNHSNSMENLHHLRRVSREAEAAWLAVL